MSTKTVFEETHVTMKTTKILKQNIAYELLGLF